MDFSSKDLPDDSSNLCLIVRGAANESRGQSELPRCIWDALLVMLLELGSSVVPVMSVKTSMLGTNYYLSRDPLAGRMGQSFVRMAAGDGCSAGM